MAKFTLADGTEVEAFTQEEVAAQVSGLKSKVEELLGETKSAKQKAKELEEAQAREADERAKEKGEFKNLYEKEQAAKRELAEQYATFQTKVQRQEIQIATTALAAELTRDSARGALLAAQAEAMAKHTEAGVVFEIGGVVVDKAKVLEYLAEKYPFLIDGTGATGGGASGSGSSGRAAQGNPTGTKAERIAHIAKKYNL